VVAGIGQGRLTDNLKQDIDLIDGAIHIPDAKTIRMIYHLLHEDGLYVGASTALNVVAAKELAEKLGKGSRVVTILCDAAYRCVRLASQAYKEQLEDMTSADIHLHFLLGRTTSCFAPAGTRPACSRGRSHCPPLSALLGRRGAPRFQPLSRRPLLSGTDRASPPSL
jgi:hypothetical protein